MGFAEGWLEGEVDGCDEGVLLVGLLVGEPWVVGDPEGIVVGFVGLAVGLPVGLEGCAVGRPVGLVEG